MSPFPPSLISGYRTFRDGRLAGERTRYRELAEHGQKPQTMVIACCDSRAAPETIFDAGPGELFVIRNVANLVPPYDPGSGYRSVPAALEFAVNGLQVGNIVVLGHARCGGISAALHPANEPLSPGDFIGTWMELLAPALAAVADDQELDPAASQTIMERLSIRQSIANLRSFPWVSEREAQGRLTLHGAWFDIANGDLWILDPETGDFHPAPDPA